MCSIFSDSKETNKFELGYILGRDDDFILLECFTIYGEHDGIACIFIDSIIKIEQETSYIKKMQKIMNHFKSKRLDNVNISKNMLTTMFDYGIENKKICLVHLCGGDYINDRGFIKTYDDEIVKIISIKDDGLLDGESIINISDISYIACGAKTANIIEILNQLE